jgi:hypothetical protein
MKQEWIIDRQAVQQMDGPHRWDTAYQCLLRWMRGASREDIPVQSQQEVHHEGGNLCAGVDATASTGSDY